jgi:hypothetical protein
MILSRWIKNDRYGTEIRDTISFGSPSIKFAKYKFDSNNSKSTLYEWLSAGTYFETQYIGFFMTESIKSWLNYSQLIDRTSQFVTNNFFTYDISQVVSSSDITQEITQLKRDDIKDVKDVVRRIDNTFQYFTPPSYPIHYEDGSPAESVSNDGEIDVVASNMVVYGILSSPENILSKNQEVPKGYTDENIALINKILEKMKSKGIGKPSKRNLLNENEIKDRVNNENFDIIDNILRQNAQNSNITMFVKDKSNRFQKFDTSYKIIRNEKSLKSIFIVRNKLLKYVPENNKELYKELYKYSNTILEYSKELLKYLLYITQFLNSSDHKEKMIVILNETKTERETERERERTIQQSQEDNVLYKRTRLKKKYLKYKIKYLNLKNQIAGKNKNNLL